MLRRALMIALLLVVCSGGVFAAALYNLGYGVPSGVVYTDNKPVVAYHNTSTAYGTRASWLWSPDSGAVAIGPAGSSTAGIALKGSTVVVAANGQDPSNASRWDGTSYGVGTWTTLPLGDGAYKVTAQCIAATPSDVFIGGYYTHSNGQRYAMRYKESVNSSTGQQLPRNTGFPLGDAYHNHSYIYGISAVTNVWVGQAQYTGSPPTGGARQAIGGLLNPTDGMAAFLNLKGYPDNITEAAAYAVALNGSRATGFSYDAAGIRWACYWDAPLNTYHGVPCNQIPMIPGSGHNYSLGTAISDDGAVIGGYSLTLGNNTTRTCWIWDSVNGTRELSTVLAELGVDTTGWQFMYVNGICSGGKILTGYGYLGGDTTKYVAWCVVIPEPTTLTILGVGLLALIRRRKK